MGRKSHALIIALIGVLFIMYGSWGVWLVNKNKFECETSTDGESHPSKRVAGFDSLSGFVVCASIILGFSVLGLDNDNNKQITSMSKWMCIIIAALMMLYVVLFWIYRQNVDKRKNAYRAIGGVTILSGIVLLGIGIHMIMVQPLTTRETNMINGITKNHQQELQELQQLRQT